MQVTFNWPAPPNVYFTTDTLLGKQTKLTFLDQEWPAVVTKVEHNDKHTMLVTLEVEEFGDVFDD